ncbi:hypothetical protein Ddc_21103 [Ditylenchus destructor]|nr:hypothetical protein Ddc_21103 [Ditylenchus destructor]
MRRAHGHRLQGADAALLQPADGHDLGRATVMASAAPTVCARAAPTVWASASDTVVVCTPLTVWLRMPFTVPVWPALIVIVSPALTVSVRCAPMVMVSLAPTLSVRLAPTVVVSFPADGLAPVRPHGDRLVHPDGLRLVVAHRLRIVHVDHVGPVVVDGRARSCSMVVANVVLAVDGDQLLARRVVHGQLVVAAALVGLGLHAADDRAGRQAVGRHGLGVVDAAGDQRLVGIAFDEIDHHFLPDAGGSDTPPSPCRPRAATRGSSRSWPSSRLPRQVPVELHFHAAVTCREDLLAAGAGHDGRLRTGRHRLGRAALGPELLVRRDGAEMAAQAGLAAVGLGRRLAQLQRGAGDQVLGVLVVARMALQREQMTRGHALRIRVAVETGGSWTGSRRAGPRHTGRRRPSADSRRDSRRPRRRTGRSRGPGPAWTRARWTAARSRNR